MQPEQEINFSELVSLIGGQQPNISQSSSLSELLPKEVQLTLARSVLAGVAGKTGHEVGETFATQFGAPQGLGRVLGTGVAAGLMWYQSGRTVEEQSSGIVKEHSSDEVVEAVLIGVGAAGVRMIVDWFRSEGND